MNQEYQQNKATEMLLDEMKPYASIVAYKNSRGNYYLESHPIDEEGNLGAAKPLSCKFIGSLIKDLSETSEEIDTGLHGLIPANILYCDMRVGTDKIVWYRPREKRYIYFSESAGIPNGEMIVPPMVYCVRHNKLSVHCFKGNKPKGKLYKAPFYNTSDESVCLGSAKTKTPRERTFENIIKYWEELYWNSEFVHILGENPVQGNLSTITKKCIMKGLPFPEDKLVKSKYRLEDLLK